MATEEELRPLIERMLKLIYRKNSKFPADHLSPEEEKELKNLAQRFRVPENYLRNPFWKMLSNDHEVAKYHYGVMREAQSKNYDLKKEIEEHKEKYNSLKKALKYGLPTTAVAGGVAGYVGGHYDARHPLRRSNEMLSYEEFLDFLNK